MQSQERNQKLNYLKYSINYLENRISMIDNRSSILIAALGILFAVYAEFLKFGFIQDGLHIVLKKLGMSFILIAFLILIATVFMLFKTIRPSPFPLGFKINPRRLEGVSFEFLWPGRGWTGKGEDYTRAFGELNDDQIMEGLKNTNFVLLGHVKMKMTYYRIAAFIVKILVMFYFISILVLYLIAFLKTN